MKIKNAILFVLLMIVIGMFLVSCDGIDKTGQVIEQPPASPSSTPSETPSESPSVSPSASPSVSPSASASPECTTNADCASKEKKQCDTENGICTCINDPVNCKIEFEKIDGTCEPWCESGERFPFNVIKGGIEDGKCDFDYDEECMICGAEGAAVENTAYAQNIETIDGKRCYTNGMSGTAKLCVYPAYGCFECKDRKKILKNIPTGCVDKDGIDRTCEWSNLGYAANFIDIGFGIAATVGGDTSKIITCRPSPTATPSVSPSASPSVSPSSTPTASATPTPTTTPIETPTYTPSETPDECVMPSPVECVEDPIPTPGPTPTSTTGYRYHTIKAENTVWGLARTYLGTGRRWREIVLANPGLNWKKLRVGQTIKIPPKDPTSTPPPTPAKTPVQTPTKTPTRTPTSQPSTKTIIVLDPGHGMGNRNMGVHDPGATYGNFKESKIALDYAKALKTKLTAEGYMVYVTRCDEITNTPLSSRVPFAKCRNADIFISIHLNSFGSSSAKGFEIWIQRSNNGEDKKLANSINTQIINKFPTLVNRGVKQNDFAVLKNNPLPANLIELGFLSNSHDRNLILNKRADYVNAIAQGIKNYKSP